MTPAVIALRYSAPLGAIEAAAAVMPFPRIFCRAACQRRPPYWIIAQLRRDTIPSPRARTCGQGCVGGVLLRGAGYGPIDQLALVPSIVSDDLSGVNLSRLVQLRRDHKARARCIVLIMRNHQKVSIAQTENTHLRRVFEIDRWQVAQLCGDGDPDIIAGDVLRGVCRRMRPPRPIRSPAERFS